MIMRYILKNLLHLGILNPVEEESSSSSVDDDVFRLFPVLLGGLVNGFAVMMTLSADPRNPYLPHSILGILLQEINLEIRKLGLVYIE